MTLGTLNSNYTDTAHFLDTVNRYYISTFHGETTCQYAHDVHDLGLPPYMIDGYKAGFWYYLTGTAIPIPLPVRCNLYQVPE